MAVLEIDAIKERILTPVNARAITEGKKLERTHKMHINGDKALRDNFLRIRNDLETESTHKLRLEVTEDVTKTVYAPILNYITKGLDMGGHTYQYHFRNDDEDILSTDFEQYLNSREWDGMDFYESIHSTIKKAHFTDFQALCYVDIPQQMQDSPFPMPYHTLFPSSQIHDIDITGHKVEFVILKEEVIIKNTGVGAREEKYTRYYCIDDAYIRVMRKDETGKVVFDTAFGPFELPNYLNYVPAFVLSHETVDATNQISRTSIVGQSMGLANLMLVDHSEHELNKRLHAFQEKWVDAEDCRDCHGDGYHPDTTDNGELQKKICTTCNGSGTRYPTGPDKIFYRKPPLDKNDPPATDPAGYIHKDLAPTEYLDKQYDKWGRAIPISVFSQELNANISPETATAKEIDDDDKQTVVRQFLKFTEVFVKNTIDAIAQLRYGDLYEGSTVIYNKNPQMRKVADLENDYDRKKKAGFDDATLFECRLDIENARYRNDPIKRKRAMLLLHLIPFPTKTDEEVANLPVSEDDKRFRAYFNDYINRFEREESRLEKFGMLLSFPEQCERILDILKKYNEPEEQEANGDGIEEPEDSRQAEAQANLRGSVGGVQGLLEVQRAVQEGTTSYDAGLEILMEIYGFDEQKAKNILGKIQSGMPPKQNITNQNAIENEQENQVA